MFTRSRQHLSLNHFAGVTIIEVMVSAVLIFLGLGSIYSLNTQSLRILRKTRQYSAASQILQERVEMLRNQPWPQVARAQSLAALFQPAAVSGQDLADADPQEDIFITLPDTPSRPVTNPASFEVLRTHGAAQVIHDGDFSAEPLLLIELTITWRDAQGLSQRRIQTIVARSGITRTGIFGSALGRPADTVTTSATP